MFYLLQILSKSGALISGLMCIFLPTASADSHILSEPIRFIISTNEVESFVELKNGNLRDRKVSKITPQAQISIDVVWWRDFVIIKSMTFSIL